MKKILAILAISVSLTSCGGDNKSSSENTYTNDFESLGHWGDFQKVVKGNAHSGLFSTITDSTNEFSLTFMINKKDLKVKEVKNIKVTAWVMCSASASKAQLVASVDGDGKNLAWQGTELAKVIKESKKWYQVEVNLPLAISLQENSLIKVYGWGDGGKEVVYWDDFTISLE